MATSKKMRDPFESAKEETGQERLLKEARFNDSLIRVLETESGRAVIARLIEESGFFTSVFDTDPLRMAYKAGKEDFAKRVTQLVMKHCPQYFQGLKDK